MMLAILSPSKRQRFPGITVDEALREKLFGYPQWLGKAEKVAAVLKSWAPHEMARHLHVSDTLAVREAALFDDWDADARYPQVVPAVLAYDGDAYRTLDAVTMSVENWLYLNRHMRILSALYGVMKPFDCVVPSRVGFDATAVRPDGRGLYDYWRDTVTQSLNRAMEETGDDVLVNLASAEFSRVIDRRALAGKMVTPVFQDIRQGKARVVSLYAKQARGLMMRYAAVHAITDAGELRRFDEGGYRFDAAASDDTVWVFRR